MTQYVLKVLLTAVVVVVVAELAKRGSVWSAVLASLPLTSVLALVWLHIDTGDRDLVAGLARNILWMVLPSLVFFLVLPALLRSAVPFWPSLGLSCAATAAAYGATLWAVGRLSA